MTAKAARAAFDEWLDGALAGSGWTAATVRGAAARPDGSVTTVALADGFAAAARALAAAGGAR